MGNKITNPKTGKSVKVTSAAGKKVIAQLPSDYTSFDVLEDKYPQLYDINDTIAEENKKKLSQQDLNIWKRAFMLSWTSNLTKDLDVVKQEIYDKLVDSCDEEYEIEEAASNWYHTFTEDPIVLFEQLYKTIDLKILTCVGL